MLDIKEILALVATMFAIVGNVPYLRDTVTKKIKPHPYTWMVWSIVSIIVFFGLLQKGAGVAAIPVGVAEAFTIIIFIYRCVMASNTSLKQTPTF